MLTIDTTKIDLALLNLVEKREQLNSTSNKAELQSYLNQLENHFERNFGTQLQTILEEVYDDLSPDETVKPVLSYLANNYRLISENDKGKIYDVGHEEGVLVETDEYGDKPTKMVVLPNPLRIVLNIDSHTREEVWSVNF